MARQSTAWSRMSARQRRVVGVALGLAVCGVVLALAVDPALGAMVISAASLVAIFTVVFTPPA
ncbi:hypothetical protein ACLQ2W_18870 [Micromonospora sp. DT227]